MKDITVLLTCAGGLESIGKIDSLKAVKERDIKIIGTDIKKDAPGKYIVDKYYTVPPGNSPMYVKKILDISKKDDVDVILPASQTEILPLSKNKKLFEDIGTVIACSNYKSIKISVDKGLLYKFLKENKLPHPDFSLPKTLKDLKNAVYKLGYPEKPVVIKPRISTGGRGFRIIKKDINRRDLFLKYKPADNIYTTIQDIETIFPSKIPNLIVSEYLPGKEYSVDILSKCGKPLIIVPRVRIETTLGISTVNIVENNPNLEKLITDIVELFNFDYNVNIQLKTSENGYIKPYEINPRISGTIAACTGMGANLIYFAVKMALNERIPKVKIKYGIKMMRYWKEMFV